eukprot:scaffold127072_cov48-Phaeocystis_antarctica.AAC.2
MVTLQRSISLDVVSPRPARESVAAPPPPPAAALASTAEPQAAAAPHAAVDGVGVGVEVERLKATGTAYAPKVFSLHGEP